MLPTKILPVSGRSAMLESLDVGQHSVDPREATVGSELVARLHTPAKPLRGTRVLHIPLQMRDGVGGLLVDSLEECAELDTRGQELVRKHFRLTRLIADGLALYSSVLESHSPRSAAGERAEDAP